MVRNLMWAVVLSVIVMSVRTTTAGTPPDAETNAMKRAAIARMYADYKKSFEDVPDITAERLVALMKTAAPVLLDVRDKAERDVSMIPGALGKQAFEDRKGDFKGRKIVVYCTIGYRSGLYAKELRKEGFDAVNLAGGVLAWTHAGQPLVHDGDVTNRLHVYGKKWDLAAEGYRTVWYDSEKKKKAK